MGYSTKLKQIRTEREISIERIADYLKIDTQEYADYESGTVDIPISAAIKIADFLGASLDDLVSRGNA